MPKMEYHGQYQRKIGHNFRHYPSTTYQRYLSRRKLTSTVTLDKMWKCLKWHTTDNSKG